MAAQIYAYSVTPLGDEALALTSGAIWVIGDEDGLVVNEQVITVSVPNGSTPTCLSCAAASTSVAATDAGNKITAMTATIIARTGTVTFSSTQSTYTFTAAVTMAATNAPTADQTQHTSPVR